MKIFDKPIILKGRNKNVVLIYSDYIISDVKKDIADLAIERIDNGKFNSLDFDLILEIKNVIGYEFKPGNDFFIQFTILKDEVRSSKTIYFDTVKIAVEAEKLITEKFIEIGFLKQEIKLTPMEAAVTPGRALFACAGFGALMTWYAYQIQFNDNETQQRRIKWYIALFQQLAKSVGYMPILVITIILVVICLIWMIRKIMNPSNKIILNKQIKKAGFSFETGFFVGKNLSCKMS